MATKTQPETDSNNKPGKDLVNKDGNVTELVEWATAEANSIEDLEALFGSQGVSYTEGQEITGDFQVITGDEKQAFLKRIVGMPVFVIKWRFNVGDNGNFVTMHIFVEGHGKFILNDGSKGGMCGQLEKLSGQRIRQGWEKGTENAGLKVIRGVAQNKQFYYSKAEGKAIPRDKLADWPAEDKALSNPSWRFEF